MTLLSQIPAVEVVEDLHEYEQIENDSQMSRVNAVIIEYITVHL